MNNTNDKQLKVGQTNGSGSGSGKIKLPAEAFEIEPLKAEAKDSEVETAFVQFTIPSIPTLSGSDSPSASVAVLNGQAKILNDEATKLFKAINERIEPIFAGVRDFGGECGKLENEGDAYYEKRVEFVENNTRVSMAVSDVFSNTVKAMVRSLVSGSVNISKFKDFILSGTLLKKADEEGNFGKDGQAIVTAHGSFLFGVRAVGLDTNGRLKRFYDLLVKATSAVMAEANELKALDLIGHLSDKTGIKAEVLTQLVQLMIEAQIARECRKRSKHYAQKAIEASQANIAKRNEAERLTTIERAMNTAH